MTARLLAVGGIDFHVGLTLLLRGWGIVAGAVIVVLIPNTLTAAQQGYYFTFASLLGLQIFFELGLSQVIVQIVSHEMAQLTIGPEGRLSGPVAHLQRLQSIVLLLRKWYIVTSLMFAVVTAPAGGILFERSGALPASAWLGPWLTLIAVTAINLHLSPMLAVREGCGQIGQVARLRLVQSVVGNALTWSSLMLGGGLWAVALTAATAALGTAYWLRAGGHRSLRLDLSQPVVQGQGIDWKREVLPFQWRIAASWMSGYLLYQLFTPLIFVRLGPIAAGRLGLSMAIFNSLLNVGVSWINTKGPQMTMLVARGERMQLDRTFLAVMKRTFAFTAVSSSLVITAAAVLEWANVPQAGRLADLGTLACLSASTVVTTLIYGAAAYMRAHREEPMLPVSAVCGVITLCAAWIASSHGTFATMLVQVVVTVAISLPWTAVLWRRYRRRSGHSAQAAR